jgi:inorganic pyrophosphatase
MEEENSIAIIFTLTGLGLIYGIYNMIKVLTVTPKVINPKEGKSDEETNLVSGGEQIVLTKEQVLKLEKISNLISDGANVFLFWEYICLIIFVALFGTLIYFTAEHHPGSAYTTVAFLIGAFTSMLCGWIGMKIATAANYRTAYKAHFGLGEAFGVAYAGGCVLGFILVSVSLAVLMGLILTYKMILINVYSKPEDFKMLFEAIAGFGLGGSSVALFCRVGGGIYTKAADVGADLVAKLDLGLEEDDPRNAACIADNVGDNVGDIAGMGSDLFGSLAEATCAALLVGSTSVELMSTGTYYYPLLITAAGIMVCFCTTLIAYVTLHKINSYERLELTIKLQIIISTVLMIPCIILISLHFLPVEYSIGEEGSITYRGKINRYQTMVCSISGLVSGMLIGIITILHIYVLWPSKRACHWMQTRSCD